MPNISAIYKITNTVNGHCYVGSTISITKRWQQHLQDLRKGKHHSTYLQRAWIKYGTDAFEFSILESCEKELLISREQNYLDTIHPEYNVCLVAGSSLGIKHGYPSEEHRKKISEANKGKPKSPEHRAKLSAANKGKTLSLETRRKIGFASKGRNVSNETREKIGNIHRGKITSEETKQKLSNAIKGRNISDEWRKNISEGHKGIKRSDKTKKKLSDFRKLWWQNKKRGAI